MTTSVECRLLCASVTADAIVSDGVIIGAPPYSDAAQFVDDPMRGGEPSAMRLLIERGLGPKVFTYAAPHSGDEDFAAAYNCTSRASATSTPTTSCPTCRRASRFATCSLRCRL